jgi:hypothetical protein
MNDLSEITGWELSTRPVNSTFSLFSNGKVGGENINLDTLPGFAGAKQAAYVNICPRQDDDGHYYKFPDEDYLRPYIALRVDRELFCSIERYIASMSVAEIQINIQIIQRSFVETKMFFTADIDFNFVFRGP